MTTCKVCGNDTEGRELCSRCTTALGLTPGEPVRRETPCAKCNHPELIRALVRELTADGGDHATRATVPMAVTYGTAVTTSAWSGKVDGTTGADERRAYGVLELYVCTRCGFTEWYCRDPKRIPIGPEYGTQKIYIRGDTPYR